MRKFEVGKQYETFSVCDTNCIWKYTVIKRTACTVTLLDDRGQIKVCKIIKKLSEINGEESVYPLGRYSMAPVLSA